MNHEQLAAYMTDLNNLANRMNQTKANLNRATDEALTQRVQIQSVKRDLTAVANFLSSDDN